ncbi:MAG: molecular chaperone TorD family protein [Betaproteobacteria bacterium]|nr:molecular chaperone TorD family protein [Betaproteobacteria bacterium]
MTQETPAESAARRSKTYWLIARLVLDRPDAAFLAELGSILPHPADAAAQAALGDVTALEALEIDYTRLFAGLTARHGAPAPFESVALESRLMGDSTMAVEAAYREAGFEPPVPEAGPSDHLGAELRFLSLACYREMEAWQADDSAAAAAWIARERRFLDEHLLVWVPGHCERLAQAAETPFYRAIVPLIAQTCQTDRNEIALLLEQTAA